MEDTNQRAEALTNTEQILEKIKHGMKKPGLDKCAMSTVDLSASISDKSVPLNVSDLRTKTPSSRRIKDWQAERQKIEEQNQPQGSIFVLRLSERGDHAERVRLNIIERPRELKYPLPYTWPLINRRQYMPDSSALCDKVLLDDWIHFPATLIGPDRLLQVTVFFTVRDEHDDNDGMMLNYYVSQLVNGPPVEFTQNQHIILPLGDVFIVEDPQDDGFTNIPEIEKHRLETQIQKWLMDNKFAEGVRARNDYHSILLEQESRT
jgi:hypothetical protein